MFQHTTFRKVDNQFKKQYNYLRGMKMKEQIYVLKNVTSSSIYMMVGMPSCCKVLEVLGVPIGILGGEEVR